MRLAMWAYFAYCQIVNVAMRREGVCVHCPLSASSISVCKKEGRDTLSLEKADAAFLPCPPTYTTNYRLETPPAPSPERTTPFHPVEAKPPAQVPCRETPSATARSSFLRGGGQENIWWQRLDCLGGMGMGMGKVVEWWG